MPQLERQRRPRAHAPHRPAPPPLPPTASGVDGAQEAGVAGRVGGGATARAWPGDAAHLSGGELSNAWRQARWARRLLGPRAGGSLWIKSAPHPTLRAAGQPRASGPTCGLCPGLNPATAAAVGAPLRSGSRASGRLQSPSSQPVSSKPQPSPDRHRKEGVRATRAGWKPR